MSLFLSIGKALSALFFAVTGWLLSKLKTANERAKTAEEDARELAQAIKSQAERERAHEKRVEEIASGDLPDARISELLSTYPPESTETARARASQGRKQGLP